MSPAPKTLTVTECHQLLGKLMITKGTHNQFCKSIRNYCMALLMLDAGLRVGEVVQLHIDDLFFSGEPVTTLVIDEHVAKKGCTRNIPVSSRLSASITEMNDFRWLPFSTYNKDYAFFTTEPTRPMTTRQVERIIRAAALRSIGRPVHPHMLRHTFASRLMRKTNARIVQELLGHRNISSTQIYTHPNGDDLKKAINSIDEPSETVKYGMRDSS